MCLVILYGPINIVDHVENVKVSLKLLTSWKMYMVIIYSPISIVKHV